MEIAGKKALSEEVPVDLARKEQKTPLLLKGGRLMENGREGDGKVTLEVKCGKVDSGKINMEVKLISPVMLRINGVELKAPNGSFLEEEPWSIGTLYSPQGPYEWSWGYHLRAGQEEKITIAVSYMTGLKRISIPVNMKFSLSGMEAVNPLHK